MTAAALVSPHFGISLVLLTVALTAWRAWTDDEKTRQAWAPRIHLLGTVAGSVLAILVAAALWNDPRGTETFPSFPLGTAMQLQASSRTLVAASPDLTFAVLPSQNPIFPAYMGEVLWGALVVLWAWNGRLGRGAFWAMCALLFYLLALGPVLKLNGQTGYGAVNPIYLFCYKAVPFVARVPYTAWFATTARISLCAAIACGLLDLSRTVRPPVVAGVLLLLVTLHGADLLATHTLPFSPALAAAAGGARTEALRP